MDVVDTGAFDFTSDDEHILLLADCHPWPIGGIGNVPHRRRERGEALAETLEIFPGAPIRRGGKFCFSIEYMGPNMGEEKVRDRFPSFRSTILRPTFIPPNFYWAHWRGWSLTTRLA